MLKWFDKYQKIILVVGGSLLMVIFLLPAGGQLLMPSGKGQVVGELGDGTNITLGETQYAAREMEMLGSLHIAFRPDGIPGISGEPLVRDSTHWLLLLAEARKNGIYFSAGQAANVLQRLAEAGLPVSSVKKQYGVTDKEVVKAVQHLSMVYQLIDLQDPDRLMFTRFSQMGQMIQILLPQPFTAAPSISASRLRNHAQKTRSKVAVDLVALDPSAFMDNIDKKPADKDAQLEKLFQEYKDAFAGEGKPYGLGYKFPDRVKLEFLQIKIKDISNSIELTDKEIYTHYINNKKTFIPTDQEIQANLKEIEDVKKINEEIKKSLEEDNKKTDKKNPDKKNPDKKDDAKSKPDPKKKDDPKNNGTDPKSPANSDAKDTGKTTPPNKKPTEADKKSPAPAKPTPNDCEDDAVKSILGNDKNDKKDDSKAPTTGDIPIPDALKIGDGKKTGNNKNSSDPKNLNNNKDLDPLFPDKLAKPLKKLLPIPKKLIPNKPRSFDDVKDQIIEKLRRDKFDDRQAKITEWLQDQLQDELTKANVKPGKDGLYDLSKFNPASLETYIAKAQKKFNVFLTFTKLDARWINVKDLETPEANPAGDLARAKLVMENGSTISLHDYVASIPAFTDSPPTKYDSVFKGKRLQVKLPSVFMEKQEDFGAGDKPRKDLFIFRITGAQKAHAPKSIDEVKETVVKDWERVQAYKQALKRKDKILTSVVGEKGVPGQKLSDLAQTYKMNVIATDPFARRETYSKPGNTPSARFETAFDAPVLKATGITSNRAAMATLNTLGRSNLFVDTIFARVISKFTNQGDVEKGTPADRFLTIPIDNRLTLFVVKVTKYDPIDRETFDKEITRIQLGISLEEMGQLDNTDSPLTFENVKKRLGYKEITRGSNNADDSGDSLQGENKPRKPL